MRFSALLGFLGLFENEIGTVSCLSRNQHLKSTYDCIKRPRLVHSGKWKPSLSRLASREVQRWSSFRVSDWSSLQPRVAIVVDSWRKRRGSVDRTTWERNINRLVVLHSPEIYSIHLHSGNCHRHDVTLDCFMALVLFNSSVIWWPVNGRRKWRARREEKRILDDSFTSKEISAFFRAFRRRVLISFILDERFFLAHSALPSTWFVLKHTKWCKFDTSTSRELFFLINFL